MAQQIQKKTLVARSGAAQIVSAALVLPQPAFASRALVQFRTKRFFCRLRAASCQPRPERRR